MSAAYRYAMFGLIGIVLILDQISKWLVLKEPAFNAIPCLKGTGRCGHIEVSSVFDLTMVWNRGVSYGAFQSEGIMRWLLVIATSAIAIGFTVWLLRVSTRWTALALALVIGGAIGNVIDRIRFGAVVDFLNFSDIYFVWVFNVADAAITVGAVLLFLDQFLLSKQQGSAQGADTTD